MNKESEVTMIDVIKMLGEILKRRDCKCQQLQQ